MTLERQIVVPGMLAEYRSFRQLVEGLSAGEWATPTRCAGWAVSDVAGHVIGQLTDVVNFRLDGLGTPEATARQAKERAGRPPKELAEELEAGIPTAEALAAGFDDEAWAAPVAGSATPSLGFGLESLWFDTYLHADDIRAALGRPTQAGEGIVPSLSHIAQVLTDQGWEPATLDFAGMPAFTVSGGGGRRIDGDPMTFVLVSTGRGDPATLGLDPSVNIYR